MEALPLNGWATGVGADSGGIVPSASGRAALGGDGHNEPSRAPEELSMEGATAPTTR